MIVVSILFTLSVAAWVIIYLIKNAEQSHKWKHPIAVRSFSFSDYYLSDSRRMNCKRCTKHSWELWNVDLCRCERCRNIAKLEGELRMTNDVYSMDQIKSAVDAFNM